MTLEEFRLHVDVGFQLYIDVNLGRNSSVSRIETFAIERLLIYRIAFFLLATPSRFGLLSKTITF